MTIWSTAASNGISVTRGQRLFTWIDCSRLLVDVPVIDTLAVLVDQGSRAEVLLEGEDKAHPAVVVMSRGSSSRLGKDGAREHHRMAEVGRAGHRGTAESGLGRRLPDRPPRLRAFPDLTLMKFLRAYLPM